MNTVSEKDQQPWTIAGVVRSYDSLIGKKCKRKGSTVIWEIWAADSDGIQIMNYSQYKNMSRCVKVDTFKRNWVFM